MKLSLPQYEIIETLYEGQETFVFRAKENESGKIVILKVSEYLENLFKMKAIFNHEYNLLKRLEEKSVHGVVKVIDLKEIDGRMVLILDDGGTTFAKVIEKEGPFDLTNFLNHAVKITNILGQIHKEGIIHKDIKPDNIALKNDDVTFIDFNISSLLAREKEGTINSKVLAGSLPYMSPEQTGRLSKDVDYRTDFYSLGITFYEMITGKTPFDGNEPMDFIHAHLAKAPTSPDQIDGKIPKFLGQIILKLLEKNPEDRYQSSKNLITDLTYCLECEKNNKDYSNAKITVDEVSGEFKIPEKLYGREGEVSKLLEIYDKSSNGENQLLLVKGVSGIGKTSLINEVQRPIVKSKGLFIKGKYDQFKKDIPYGAIREAFAQLPKQLMVLKEETFEIIKTEFESVLGPFSRVITDVIPELLPLLGEHPPVEELPPAQAMNRFNFQMVRFFQVLARKDTPFVIFIDDLQWADTAGLNLLRKVIKSDVIKHLLIIGAYRDNEVGPQHPLVRVIDELNDARGSDFISEMVLNPLTEGIVDQLFIDMFKMSQEEVADVARYVEEKTEGNPFFIHELLKKLYKDELINFYSDEGKWQFDVSKILMQEISGNVVEMMIEKLKSLPTETQFLLKMGSCLGNEFSLNLLSVVTKMKHQEILSNLWDAVTERVLFPVGSDFKIMQGKLYQEFYQNENDNNFDELFISYRFVHDRIQQAAYALINEEDKNKVHLDIARIMAQKLSKEELEKHFFDIVNHYNIGHELIVEQDEKDFVKKMNADASEKAMNSQAFGPSLQFIKLVMEKYDDLNIKKDYDRVINYYKIRIKAEYLNGNYKAAEDLAIKVIPNCQKRNDKADIYIDLISLCSLISEDKKASYYAIKALRLYGIWEYLYAGKPRFIVVLLWAAFRLRKLDYENLHKLPEISDDDAKRVSVIASTVAPSAYLYSVELAIIIVLRVQLRSIQYGIVSDSAFNLATLGACYSVFFHRFSTTRKLFEAGTKIIERFPTQKGIARLNQVLGYFSFNCFFPIEEVKKYGLKGMLAALNGGDYTYSTYNYASCGLQHITINNSLTESEKIAEKSLHLARELKTKDMIWVSSAELAAARCLLGKIENSNPLIDNESGGSGFNEHELVFDLLKKEKNKAAFALSTDAILTKMVVFNEYKSILKIISYLKDYVFVQIGSFNPHFYQFAMALSMMGLNEQGKVGLFKRLIYFLRVTFYIVYNYNYYKYSPTNMGSYFHTLVAAFYSLLNLNIKKHRHLLKASIFAKRNSEWKNLGVVEEVLARSYFNLGKFNLLIKHIKSSIHSYSAWGAYAKVTLLKNEFTGVFDSERTQQNLKTTVKGATQNEEVTTIKNLSTTIARRTFSSESGGLDLQSAMKFTQILAGEIHLEKLFRKLLDVLLKNAGAEKVFIIRDRKENIHDENALIIDAESKIGKETLIFHRQPLKDSLHLSKKIIKLVYKGNGSEEVLLADASTSDEFQDDAYISKARPKSILCLPIMNKGKLQAIIYMENNLSAGAFTEERVGLLRMLTGQLAVSMENAQLYEHLEEKVRERTEELKEAQKQVLELAHQSGMADIASGVMHNIGNILPKIYMAIDELKIEIPHKEVPVLEKMGEKVEAFLTKGASDEEKTKLIKAHKIVHERINDHTIHSDELMLKLKSNIDQITAIVAKQKKYAHTQKAFKSEIPLRPVIEDLIEKSKDLLHGIKVNLSIEGIFEEKVFTEKHKYLFAITEILKNASEKLNDENVENKEISIKLRQVENNFITEIIDNGSFIDEKLYEEVFHSGYTTKKDRGGMGLHDSYNFIHSMSGVMKLVNNTDSKGVIVRMEIPIEQPNKEENLETSLEDKAA